jgi:deoxyribodipyrimidine photolyase-related protein
VIASEPNSHGQQRSWLGAGIRLVPNGAFLTGRGQFAEWASGQRTLRMDAFYRWQRRRLDILMDGEQPVGGAWSFDADNRLPPPKEPHPWPDPIHHGMDALDEEVWDAIARSDISVAGQPPNGAWATTRAGALRQLEWFMESAFADFGPYEDAMPTKTWAVNHSMLSPYLNLGLLHPSEVVEAAVNRFDAGGIPISSAEGFIRQIIGWREYVHGLYWHFGPDYATRNGLQAQRPLPPAISSPGSTRMACVESIVQDIDARAWTHHIPRLMVLANLALISGIRPQALLDWMRRMFVDASDWVMVPNVIGMGVHADGGQIMTKPYAAGGAYINRMGRFCKGCAYDPGKRVGDDACPFTTLYWDFLDRHRAEFARNPRMAQQVRGLDRLADLDAVRTRARDVLAALEDGRL